MLLSLATRCYPNGSTEKSPAARHGCRSWCLHFELPCKCLGATVYEWMYVFHCIEKKSMEKKHVSKETNDMLKDDCHFGWCTHPIQWLILYKRRRTILTPHVDQIVVGCVWMEVLRPIKLLSIPFIWKQIFENPKSTLKKWFFLGFQKAQQHHIQHAVKARDMILENATANNLTRQKQGTLSIQHN